jgi:NagD protein
VSGPGEKNSFALARVRHVVLDMDGTLYRGKRLFAATLPFLDRLRRLGIGYTFLTNNTSLSKSDYLAKLRRFGIDAAEDEISTPADATIAYLRDQFPHVGTIAVLGTPRPAVNSRRRVSRSHGTRRRPSWWGSIRR